MRAPEAPIGCPRARAPPSTFTISGSTPRIRVEWIDPRERLVYLHEIQVLRSPPRLLERQLPRVAGHGEQVRRLLGDLGVGDYGPQRLEVPPFGEGLACEHQRSCSVGDAGGVARCHGAALVY